MKAVGERGLLKEAKRLCGWKVVKCGLRKGIEYERGRKVAGMATIKLAIFGRGLEENPTK